MGALVVWDNRCNKASDSSSDRSVRSTGYIGCLMVLDVLGAAL